MSGSNRRDDAVARLLRQTSSAGPDTDPPAERCLDAETVAAWMDGGLSPQELAAAEAHAAGCARCQALLSAFARVDSGPPAAQAPAAAPGWRAWLPWLVPATAAATALALWIAVPRDPAVPVVDSLSARVDPPVERAQRPAPAAEPRDLDARSQKTPSPPQAPSAAAPSRSQPPRQDTAARTLTEASRQGGVAERAEARTVAPPAPAAPPPPPAASADASVAPPAVARAREAPAVAGFRVAAPAVVVVAAADSRVRWRLRGNAVDRSGDAGGQWDTVVERPGASLLAGSAPSVDVCWIVGQAGLVLRATDGRTFTRLPSPTADDLGAVQAIDGERATVTTVSGARFTTTDGGSRWVPAR